jgi:hypothetical protein
MLIKRGTQTGPLRCRVSCGVKSILIASMVCNTTVLSMYVGSDVANLAHAPINHTLPF